MGVIHGAPRPKNQPERPKGTLPKKSEWYEKKAPFLKETSITPTRLQSGDVVWAAIVNDG
jgi:hypothetical protein